MPLSSPVDRSSGQNVIQISHSRPPRRSRDALLGSQAFLAQPLRRRLRAIRRWRCGNADPAARESVAAVDRPERGAAAPEPGAAGPSGRSGRRPAAPGGQPPAGPTSRRCPGAAAFRPTGYSQPQAQPGYQPQIAAPAPIVSGAGTAAAGPGPPPWRRLRSQPESERAGRAARARRRATAGRCARGRRARRTGAG